MNSQKPWTAEEIAKGADIDRAELHRATFGGPPPSREPAHHRASKARDRGAEPKPGLRPLSNQWVEDVIVTATEGGINYWATVVSRVLPSDNVGDGRQPSAVIAYTLEGEGDDPAERKTRATINRALLQKAIDLLAGGTVQVRTDILGAILLAVATGEADLDVEAVDVLVQVGLLGEIVFG